jgi:hypothetical protein
MRTFQRVLIVFLYSVCAMVMIGATPVARVIGTEPVDVDGIAAPARNFVPVAVGNEITTQAGSAVVQFRDGSNVVLQPNSQLRIEGPAARPQVHVTRGSATYDLAGTSKLRIVDSKGETISRVLDNALPDPVSPLNRPESPLAEAVVYRATAASRQSGFVAPLASVSVGQFVSGGTAVNAAGAATLQIVMPNGLTINLAATVDPITGVTTYTVASIQQTITNPVTGQAVTVTVTSGSLIGATVGGIAPSTQTGTSVDLTFTLPGQTTPMTSADASTSVQTGVQTAVNTAIQNGQLPAGTVVPPPGPIQTGQFSGSAP